LRSFDNLRTLNHIQETNGWIVSIPIANNSINNINPNRVPKKKIKSKEENTKRVFQASLANIEVTV
jgi:hypothetical protein